MDDFSLQVALVWAQANAVRSSDTTPAQFAADVVSVALGVEAKLTTGSVGQLVSEALIEEVAAIRRSLELSASASLGRVMPIRLHEPGVAKSIPDVKDAAASGIRINPIGSSASIWVNPGSLEHDPSAAAADKSPAEFPVVSVSADSIRNGESGQ